MSLRTDNDVTLSHSEAEWLAVHLNDEARRLHQQARQTRSATHAVLYQRDATKCRELSAKITQSLWTWS